MSYEYDPHPEEEPSPAPRWNCLYRAIVILLILSLLGSAVTSLIWLASRPPAGGDGGDATGGDPPLPATPQAERLNRITFINLQGQVETIAPDGSDRRVLTDETQLFQFPAWSPDGRYIAVIGNDADGGGLYRLLDQEDAGRPRQLYFSRDQRPFYLYWSPDSRQISFLTNQPEDGIGLYLAPADEQGDSRLLASGSPFYWNWSADATQLFIHVGFAGDAARLALIDADGDGRGDNLAQPGFFQAPGISASGRYLAYAEQDTAGASWLALADTISDNDKRHAHTGLVAMSWNPAQDTLAFVNGAEGSGHFFGPLQLLDAETGEVRLLSQGLVLAFFWSPDGRTIAYLSPSGGDGGINAAAGQPGQRRPLLARMGAPAAQRPDPFLLNLYVVDIVTGQGRHLKTFPATRLFVTQFLPFFDQYALSHWLWSPGSDALVLPVQANNRSELLVIPTSGAASWTLSEGEIGFWSRQ